MPVEYFQITMLLINIWFLYHVEQAFSQKAIERFELADSDALSLKFRWQLSSAVNISTLNIRCLRSDDKESTSSSILVAARDVTIKDLAPSTKYKCELEVSYFYSTETSDFVYAETLIGEACMQPVGFETGIINDDSTVEWSKTNSKKEYIKLHNGNGFWCSSGGGQPYIKIDLGRIMTVTGFAIQGDNSAVDEIFIKYSMKHPAATNADATQEICTENDKERVRKTFKHSKKQVKRYWFLESGFTVRFIEFLSVGAKEPFCLQAEIYGCSEICSSKLNPLSIYHIFQSNSSSSNKFDSKRVSSEFVTSKCFEVNQSLRFDFGKVVTVSGFMLLIKNASVQVNVSVRYGNRDKIPTLETPILKAFLTSSVPQSYVTFWFDDILLTRYIELIPVSKGTCMFAIFTGCNSANMKKLGIEARKPEITLTASSSYGNGPGNNADKGRLNAMIGDWTSHADDPNPWFQICFNKLQTVSAIALQGQGYYNKGHITEFSIKYGYNIDSVSYLYSVIGSNYRFSGTNCRYATTVNEFPVELAAQCLRLEQFLFYHSVSARLELLGNEESFPPAVDLPKQVFNLKNSTATVLCVVFGQPGVFLQWKNEFNGEKLITNDNINYIITTNNDSSNVNGTYKSYLEIKPEVHLNVDNNNTDCRVYDNKTASCFFGYSVTASYTESNGVFSHAKTTLIFIGYDAAVDDPVATVVATNVSINITWSTGENIRDFKSLFYNLQLIEHGRLSNTTVNSNTFNSFQWFGSKPYTSYTFLLTAFNRLGMHSNTVQETFITAEGYPSKVLNFSVLSVSKESITLIWYYPENPNGNITSYSVEYGELNSSSNTLLAIPAIHLHLDNQAYEVGELRNFQEYKFRLRAVTNRDLNPGVWSNWIERRTLEGSPSAPENLYGNATSSRDIFLRWTEPKHPNGILRSYTISFNGSKYYNSSFKHYGQSFISSTEINLQGLFPGTSYEIFVNAKTIEKGPSSESINVMLPYDEPLAPVLKLEYQNPELRKIVLYAVSSFTGPISYHEVNIQENIENCTSRSKATFTINSSSSINELLIRKGIQTITLDKEQFQLGLIGTFLVCYRAVINDTLSGNVYKGTFSHLFLDRNDLAKMKKEEISVGVSTITFSLSRGPLSTRYYQIIVFKGDPKGIDPSPPELKPYKDNSKIYIAAEFEASDFDYLQNFTVGDGKIYNRSITAYTNFYNYASGGVENVKLQDGTSYAILQRAYENGAKYYSTPWLVNVQTEKKTTALPLLTLAPLKKAGIGGVIGGVSGGAVCIIIVLAVLGVKIIRRKPRVQNKELKNVSKPHKGDDYNYIELGKLNLDLNINNETQPVEGDYEEVHDKRNLFDSVNIDLNHPPVNLAAFPQYWEWLSKDNYSLLSEEYKCLIPAQNTMPAQHNDIFSPFEAGYINLIEDDCNRKQFGGVKKHQGNKNFNFVWGYVKQSAYIVIQALNKCFSNEFWNMIWEQNIPLIVTDNAQTEIQCCWPTSVAETYGNIQVEHVYTETFSFFVIRRFSIFKNGCREKKFVSYYQYLKVSDDGAPELASDIATFSHQIRKIFPYKQNQKTIVVDCSTGKNSGTFICIDAMLELAKQQRKVDVFNYVNFIRSKGLNIIKTENQYKLVYRALYESLTCGFNEITVADYQTQDELSLDRLRAQLINLDLLTQKPSADKTINALKDVNKLKNRDPMILPGDDKRVVLTESMYENDFGDYINAVYVQGFKNENEFIATQHPLPSTIADFWSMILQKKINTIVLLHDVREDSGLPELHGALNFKVVHKNACVVFKQQVVDGCITQKKIFVSSTRDKDTVECTILYFNWPLCGVPGNPNELITLISQMEIQQCKHEGSSVVVVCRDGASRCGTYLACALILQYLKLERSVDIFRIVRKLRTSRFQFVNNVHHYKFCYDLISTFINTFDNKDYSKLWQTPLK